MHAVDRVVAMLLVLLNGFFAVVELAVVSMDGRRIDRMLAQPKSGLK